VIFHSATSSDEDVHSIFELASLGCDAHSSVDGDDREFSWVVLDLVDLVSDLDGELSRRCEHDCLDLSSSEQAIGSQVLDDRQSEGKGLSRTCEISSDEIFPLEDWLEALLLDREETSYSLWL